MAKVLTASVTLMRSQFCSRDGTPLAKQSKVEFIDYPPSTKAFFPLLLICCRALVSGLIFRFRSAGDGQSPLRAAA